MPAARIASMARSAVERSGLSLAVVKVCSTGRAFASPKVPRALIAACYECLARSFFGASLSFVDVLVLLGFVSFGAVIQIPGIGGGMKVVTIVVLTELFAVKLEVAAAFAMLIWIITFVAVVPVGLGLALKEGLDWHSLRRISRETSA